MLIKHIAKTICFLKVPNRRQAAEKVKKANRRNATIGCVPRPYAQWPQPISQRPAKMKIGIDMMVSIKVRVLP